MTIEIVSKIVAVSVKTTNTQTPTVVVRPQKMRRPEVLFGRTYQIKTPVTDFPLYLTINDVVDEDGVHRPFEVFCNTKSVESLQWVTAFTRLLSGIFRKGGDVTFVLEELSSVHDPKGGFFRKGGTFVPSLVAEIGNALRTHFEDIGLIERPQLSEEQQALIAEKASLTSERAYCPKCQEKSYILDGGCGLCENCMYSKCG